MRYLEVANEPELLRLVEEVQSSSEPCMLRRNGEDVAMLLPVKRRRIKAARTDADYAAFRAAAGGWKDVDVDRFLADNQESRRISTRPPVEL
jgi:hypothetical protein